MGQFSSTFPELTDLAGIETEEMDLRMSSFLKVEALRGTKISRREQEIVALLSLNVNMRSKEIAEKFGTSPRTVKVQLHGIFMKCGVKDRAQLVTRFNGGGEYQPALTKITVRENQVWLRLADGYSVKEIASDLNLSAATVEQHKATLMRKLRVHKQAQLILKGIAHGIATVAPATLSAQAG